MTSIVPMEKGMNCAWTLVVLASGTTVIMSKTKRLRILARGRETQISSSKSLLCDHKSISIRAPKYNSKTRRMIDDTSDVGRKLSLSSAERMFCGRPLLTTVDNKRQPVHRLGFYIDKINKTHIVGMMKSPYPVVPVLVACAAKMKTLREKVEINNGSHTFLAR